MNEQNDRYSSISPPAYFGEVKRNSERRWEQLEGDPELAGPWHQLFRQVQSPRHVLSELLQNADDCNAETVHVTLNDNTFTFRHDGDDFSASDFGSLCRFGYSNKRNLHTIGFRGIGFKSTFSLGDSVQVATPTLSIEFQKQRFTEPLWRPCKDARQDTEISVAISDQDRASELRKNLNEWAKSAASLLFFANIRHLHINDATISRTPLGPGPIPNSQWVQLTNEGSYRLLVISSEEEEFPDDAYLEIKQERAAEDLELPPCRVEIVAGLPDSRLYVVLPTNVEPRLPFSCNAPFMQDPARTGIKNPSTSPTNRWLLARIGKLAANSMIQWLGRTDLPLDERAKAYQLLRRPAEPGDTVAIDCVNRICKEFNEACSAQPILLTSRGSLACPGVALAPPPELYSVWTDEELGKTFGTLGQPLLAREVNEVQRNALSAWNWLSKLSDQTIVVKLRNGGRPPKPQGSAQLLALWEYIRKVQGKTWALKELMIVPVEHSRELYRPDEVVRLGRSKTLARVDDWEFLSDCVVALDREWIEFLSTDPDELSPNLAEQISDTRETLRALQLDSASTWDKIIGVATTVIFGQSELSVAKAIRFTHIVAAVNAKVPDTFKYVTRDRRLRSPAHGVVVDPSGRIDDFVPSEWSEAHILDDAYSAAFESCSRVQWETWSRSESSKLCFMLPLKPQSLSFRDRGKFEDFLATRNIAPPTEYKYRSGRTRIDDRDFGTQLVSFWLGAEDTQADLWHKILKLLIDAPPSSWRNECIADAREVSSGNNHTKPADCDPVPAAWVARLQKKKCLPDTYGMLCQPAELFMRTPNTEPLMGVERFVKAEYDTPATKDLLRLLGVNDSAAGPEKIIQRIRVLANSHEVLTNEVRKWYEALDRLMGRGDPNTIAELRATFAQEALILTKDEEWATSHEVFVRASDEDIPDAPVVHTSVNDLSMWSRLHVAERPSADLVIKWLQELASGSKLEAANLKRVRNYIHRFPIRIWTDCSNWLAIDGHWRRVESLDFSLLSASDARVGDLFPDIKSRTADLRGIPREAAEAEPFTDLRSLGKTLSYRLTEAENSARAEEKLWLQTLGTGLQRVRLSENHVTENVRQTAKRLGETQWQPVRTLHVTPYLDDAPAGQPHSPPVLWHDRTLFAESRPVVELIRDLGDELSRVFGISSIGEAIKYCVDREPEFITCYLEHNFDLDEAVPDGDSAEDNGESSAAAAKNLEESDLGQGNFGDALKDGQQDHIGLDDIDQLITDATASGQELVEDELSPAEIEEPFDEPDEPESEKPQRKVQPKLIDRFAAVAGLVWDEDRGIYVHPSGLRLCQGSGPYQWQLYSATGQLKQSYWLSEQCLTTMAGIELNAEIWNLLAKSPETHAFVLVDESGQPKQWLGPELLSMVQGESMSLYPAKYRLRIE